MYIGRLRVHTLLIEQRRPTLMHYRGRLRKQELRANRPMRLLEEFFQETIQICSVYMSIGQHSGTSSFTSTHMCMDLQNLILKGTFVCGCQLSKAKASTRFASSAHRRVSNIFSWFSMDLIDMTTISKVYRYVLVLQDYYCSFNVLTNLRNKKT